LNHPDIYEILELMEFEHFSFQDYTELLFGQNTPEAAYSAYLILKENLYFNGSIADGVCANPIDLIE